MQSLPQNSRWCSGESTVRFPLRSAANQTLISLSSTHCICCVPPPPPHSCSGFISYPITLSSLFCLKSSRTDALSTRPCLIALRRKCHALTLRAFTPSVNPLPVADPIRSLSRLSLRLNPGSVKKITAGSWPSVQGCLPASRHCCI